MRNFLTYCICLLGILSTHLVFAGKPIDDWYHKGYYYSQIGDNKQAFIWTMRAAKAGHVAAQNNIGLSYLHGLGVEQDKQKAFKWFESAAKQGLPYAQSELAMLYYQKGKSTKAQQWWLMAANSNDGYAQFNLASLFLERNQLEKALYWFKKAKDNNHPRAQKALDFLTKRAKNVIK